MRRLTDRDDGGVTIDLAVQLLVAAILLAVGVTLVAVGAVATGVIAIVAGGVWVLWCCRQL